MLFSIWVEANKSNPEKDGWYLTINSDYSNNHMVSVCEYLDGCWFSDNDVVYWTDTNPLLDLIHTDFVRAKDELATEIATMIDQYQFITKLVK